MVFDYFPNIADSVNNNNNNNNKGYLSTPHLKRAQGALQDNNTMVKTTDQDKIFTT